MLVGFILLIIPAFIFAVMFSMATYLVIDKNLSPVEAMKESRRITNGHKWDLVVLSLLLLLVNILGLLALVVGLLVSLPVSSLAVAHAYRTLVTNAGPKPAVEA